MRTLLLRSVYMELAHQTQPEAVDALGFVLPSRWLLRHSFLSFAVILVAGQLSYHVARDVFYLVKQVCVGFERSSCTRDLKSITACRSVLLKILVLFSHDKKSYGLARGGKILRDCAIFRSFPRKVPQATQS